MSCFTFHHSNIIKSTVFCKILVEKNDNKQKGAGVGPLKIYKAIAVRCELKQVVTLRLYLLRSVQN